MAGAGGALLGGMQQGHEGAEGCTSRNDVVHCAVAAMRLCAWQQLMGLGC
jgi:hypothetical protein